MDLRWQAMHRPARVILSLIALRAIAACAGACGGQSPEADEGNKVEPVMYKRLVLSLELLPSAPERGEDDNGGRIDLWLIETDETGSTKRVDLGQQPGPCQVRRNPPGVPMKPLFALECTGGEGARVRVVYQRDQVIVLRAPGASGDEMDFEESQRIDLPRGVRVLTE
jgi:hypothetical protein